MDNSTDNLIYIPLSKTGRNKGKYTAIVDVTDIDFANLNWYAQQNKKTFYANRFEMTKPKKTLVVLHREIMAIMIGRPLEKDEIVDHINGNGLDCRRKNLRLVTQSQSSMNRSTRSDNTSGYKGVKFHKQSGKWHAYVTVQGKVHSLGLHDTPELAYQVRCEYADKLHGEYQRKE